MKPWLKWAIVCFALVACIAGGAFLGTVGKTRSVTAPDPKPPTKEEQERAKINMTLLTTGPIPSSKLKLSLTYQPDWVVDIEAESDDGKLASVLQDARGLFLSLSDTGVPIKRAAVTFRTSALRDTYGKAMEKALIARILIQQATWNKIDWSGFDPRNFSSVADEYWLHPLLQKQELPPPRPDNAAMISQ